MRVTQNLEYVEAEDEHDLIDEEMRLLVSHEALRHEDMCSLAALNARLMSAVAPLWKRQDRLTRQRVTSGRTAAKPSTELQLKPRDVLARMAGVSREPIEARERDRGSAGPDLTELRRTAALAIPLAGWTALGRFDSFDALRSCIESDGRWRAGAEVVGRLPAGVSARSADGKFAGFSKATTDSTTNLLAMAGGNDDMGSPASGAQAKYAHESALASAQGDGDESGM